MHTSQGLPYFVGAGLEVVLSGGSENVTSLNLPFLTTVCIVLIGVGAVLVGIFNQRTIDDACTVGLR